MTLEVPAYRYLFTDMVKTGPSWVPTVLGELQLTNVTWSQELNAPGQFTGSILITDERLQETLGTMSGGYRSGLEYVTQPWRVAVYVERNKQIVFGGPITTRQWDSESQTLTITAETFDSYFGRRIVQESTGQEGALIFDWGTDQFQVFVGTNGIFANMIAYPNGDIGIAYDSTALSGAPLAGAYVVYDYEHKTVMQVLEDHYRQNTAYDDNGVPYTIGFDWWVDCAYDLNGNLTRTFRMYYPAKGNQDLTSATLPVLEFPGSVVSYTWPEDGTSLVTKLHGLGPGTAEGQYATEAAPSTTLHPDIGDYPLLQDVQAFTMVPDTDAIDSLTQAQADVRGAPVVTPSFTWVPAGVHLRDTGWDGHVGPAIGEFAVGDIFSIRLNDARFYGGVEEFLRLVKFDVQVGDSGAETVTGEFSFKSY